MRVLLAAFLFCAIAAPAMARELDPLGPPRPEPQEQHKIYLVLTYVTPGRNTPDIREKFPMESIDECWENAQDFVNRGVPAKLKDAVIATMAGCLVLKPDETDM